MNGLGQHSGKGTYLPPPATVFCPLSILNVGLGKIRNDKNHRGCDRFYQSSDPTYG
jgi:hypothetical protein